jgi:hypothetical protein
MKGKPLTLEAAAVALRAAAVAYAQGLQTPVMDARDSTFRKLDLRLQRAALTYAEVANDPA